MKFLKDISYKVRLIGVFILVTVTGVTLMLIAVYNASRELEVIYQIENMHDMLQQRMALLQQHASEKAVASQVDKLAELLTTHSYRVVPYNADRVIPINMAACELTLNSRSLIDSRINEYGGYIQNNDCIYTWTLIPVNSQAELLLVLHQYRSTGLAPLYYVYKNRLVIPVVFFIWMTVWGSLILANLVKRLQIQKEEVEHMALHDPLTGLANRHLFSEKLHEVISYATREGQSFALAVIDLDRFKTINDTLGHNYGDELLKQVAHRFREVIRDYDVIARVGGDEFVLLLPDTDRSESKQILQRIYQRLVQDYTLFQQTLQIGASIGVASFPGDDTEFTELIHKADNAMYSAKSAGGGIRYYSDTLAEA